MLLIEAAADHGQRPGWSAGSARHGGDRRGRREAAADKPLDIATRRRPPITEVTETLRSLLLGTPAGSHPWLAPAWCTGMLAASVALAGVLFRRRTAA